MYELSKGGMLKVDYAGTSIDQKLNHAWNCSIIKVTHGASIFQLKARVEKQNVGTKMICKSVINCKSCYRAFDNHNKSITAYYWLIHESYTK